jgi:hypothetical protein
MQKLHDRELMALMAAILINGYADMTPHDAVVIASQILFEIEHRPSIERTKRT